MPVERDFCRYEDCGFLLTDIRHFKTHVSRSDWPRWTFVKGGAADMTDDELDALGAPQVRQRGYPVPAPRIDETITSPVSLMCDCGWTTPFGSKNHASALRMHRARSKQHREAVSA